MSSLRLMNPHSVLAALATRPRDVLEVHAGARSNEAWQEVIEAARPHHIAIRDPIPRDERGRGPSRDGGRAGTTYAVVRERAGLTLEQLFATDDSRGIWLALDQLQDPHNVGAVFRTAAFFGVKGIVLTVDRSAPLTPTVYDVASGGLEHVPFVMQTNLARAIDVAKKNNMWVLGSSEHATQDVSTIDRDRRWLVLVGNEEKGLRRLSLEKCDEVCGIIPQGLVTSLNVSVAAGVLMSTLSRP